MRFSKDKITELREKVRVLMIRNPNISISGLQKSLSGDYGGRIFDKNFVAKIKNKIHKEWAIGYNHSNLNVALAYFEDLILCGRTELAAILFNDDGKQLAKDRVGAYRAIVWAQGLLIESKKNSGVYNKDPADQRKHTLSPEQNEIIDQALQFASDIAEQSKKERE